MNIICYHASHDRRGGRRAFLLSDLSDTILELLERGESENRSDHISLIFCQIILKSDLLYKFGRIWRKISFLKIKLQGRGEGHSGTIISCVRMVISLTKKWDVKSRVAIIFYEWNECKNLQRDFDSPILSWGQKFFTQDARKRDL